MTTYVARLVLCLRHSSVCIRIKMGAACPSILASIRMIGTVFLRAFLVELVLESRNPFLRGQVLVARREDAALCVLRFDAALVELVGSAILLDQLLVMVLDISDDGIEFRLRQAWHRDVDKVEVVAAMQVVKNIQHRNWARGKLWPAAAIDDFDGFGLHGILLPASLRWPFAGINLRDQPIVLIASSVVLVFFRH